MSPFARKWTPVEVVSEILACAAAGNDLCYSAMREAAPALVRAAEREFGCWGDAVQAAGFDYQQIRRYRRWTRERVIARIQELHTQGADLSWYAVMTTVDPPLAAAALHGGRFACWNDALRAAGLEPARIAKYQHWTPDLIHQEVTRIVSTGVPLERRALKRQDAALLAAIDRYSGGLSGVRARIGQTARARVAVND